MAKHESDAKREQKHASEQNPQLKQQMMADAGFVAGTLEGLRDIAEGRYTKATKKKA